ncbi:MAG: hypothetical protein ACXWF8_16950 [Methylobacter sp.]
MKTLAMSVLFGSLSMARLACAEPQQLFATDVFLPTFSDGYIQRLDANGSGLKKVISTGDGARGIAVDTDHGEIFWSDVNRHVISKADLNGKHKKDIVTEKLEFPADVDLDRENKKIYWSDTTNNQIGRSNLDGSEQKLIIPLPCHNNIGFGCAAEGNLAIDRVQKKLYWTIAYCTEESCSALSSNLGDILRSNLDGGHIETVVTAIGRPSSIQIDPIGKKIYWTDYVNDVVRRANLDGTQVEDLFVVGKNNNPNSLTLDLKNGHIYWNQDGDEANRSCIKRMDLDGGSPQDIKCGLGNMPDIEFVLFHNRQPEHERR